MISTQKHDDSKEVTASHHISFGNQKEKTLLTNKRNSYKFDKFGVIWVDKWLHEDTFGVITNTEIAFSTDKYYRPTLLLAIEQNFYTCVDYEVSEVIETEIGKILCGMNDITYGIVGYIRGNHCLCNKKDVITSKHDLRICLCLVGRLTKRMSAYMYGEGVR